MTARTVGHQTTSSAGTKAEPFWTAVAERSADTAFPGGGQQSICLHRATCGLRIPGHGSDVRFPLNETRLAPAPKRCRRPFRALPPQSIRSRHSRVVRVLPPGALSSAPSRKNRSHETIRTFVSVACATRGPRGAANHTRGGCAPQFRNRVSTVSMQFELGAKSDLLGMEREWWSIGAMAYEH